LNVRNLRPETRNLFPKDNKMIHVIRIPHLSAFRPQSFPQGRRKGYEGWSEGPLAPNFPL
jgi:hypothetical protein